MHRTTDTDPAHQVAGGASHPIKASTIGLTGYRPVNGTRINHQIDPYRQINRGAPTHPGEDVSIVQQRRQETGQSLLVVVVGLQNHPGQPRMAGNRCHATAQIGEVPGLVQRPQRGQQVFSLGPNLVRRSIEKEQRLRGTDTPGP